MKTCTKCHIEKPLDDYYSCKGTPSGRRAICKTCWNYDSRLYGEKHREQISQHNKEYRAVHKDEINKNRRDRYEEVRPRVLAYHKKNKEHIYAVKKIYRNANKERISSDFKRWAEENRDEYLARRRERNAIRRATNPKDRLNASVSARVRDSLVASKCGRSWEILVGYNLEKLKKHIEQQFAPGMSWENYGRWHVDHRIPIKAFNFSTPDDLDFKRCWELKNLQPLWAFDNVSKGARLERPFQPSLAIGT